MANIQIKMVKFLQENLLIIKLLTEKKIDYYKLKKSDLSKKDYCNIISKIKSDNKDSKYFNNIYNKSKIPDEFQPQKMG